MIYDTGRGRRNQTHLAPVSVQKFVVFFEADDSSFPVFHLKSPKGAASPPVRFFREIYTTAFVQSRKDVGQWKNNHERTRFRFGLLRLIFISRYNLSKSYRRSILYDQGAAPRDLSAEVPLKATWYWR